MDFKEFTSKTESLFQKSEYITLSHMNAKMMTLIKASGFKSNEIFCFIIDAKPSYELCKRLCDYTKSVTFYSGKHKNSEICVVIIFSSDSESTAMGSLSAGRKFDKITCMPFCFNKAEGVLTSFKSAIFSDSKEYLKFYEFLNPNA